MSAQPQPIQPWQELLACVLGAAQFAACRPLLRQRREWHQSEAAEALCAEAQRLLRVDVAAAARLAQAARQLAVWSGDVRAQAEAIRLQGHAAYLSGRYRPALHAYERALPLLTQAGDELAVARTLSSALQTLMYLGRDGDALAWAARAREIFARHHDEIRLAHLDSNCANLLHRKGDLDEAMALYESALATLQRRGDPVNAATVLRNLAVCAMDRYDFLRALEAYEQARRIYAAHGQTQLLQEVRYNVPYLHYLRGDYTRAVTAYQALEDGQARDANSFHDAVAQLDQSDLYLELNLPTKAVELADAARQAFLRLGTRHEAARAALNHGLALSAVGDVQGAHRLLQEARRLFRQEKNGAWVAVTDLYRALLWMEDNQGLARRAALAAERVLAASSLHGKAALASLVLARLEMQAGQWQQAHEHCARALHKALQAEAGAVLFQVYSLNGQLAEAEGDPPRALAYYRQAHAILLHLRAHLQHDNLKLSFLRDKLPVYGPLVRLLLRVHGRNAAAEALLFAEQAKSRSLAEMLAFRADWRSQASTHSDFTAADRVHALRQELCWCYHQVDRAESRREGPDANAARYRLRIPQVEEALSLALATLRRVDPELGHLQGGSDLPIEELQAVLPPDTALFEYFEAEGELLLFVLRTARVQVVPLGSMTDVRLAARLLRFQLARAPEELSAAASLQAVDAHLRRLYDLLVRPAAAYLPSRHLVIAPHGDLHGLPLHALQSEEGCLAERCLVSYTLSATVHALGARRVREEARGPALVLGVPDAQAPSITQEAQLVADLLPGAQSFLGEAATADRLRSDAPDARLIHLATHGLFRQDNPLFSSIRLGDTRLCLFDLYDLTLRAQLVTLSGCCTGLGSVAAGDELVGLTRGLLFAGARGVQVTLWQVHDESTTLYMAQFYRHCAAGASPLEASQQALLALRAVRPHPYYWAAYILFGQVADLDQSCLASPNIDLEAICLRSN